MTPIQRVFLTIDVAIVRDLPIKLKARRVSGGKKSPIELVLEINEQDVFT